MVLNVNPNFRFLVVIHIIILQSEFRFWPIFYLLENLWRLDLPDKTQDTQLNLNFSNLM